MHDTKKNDMLETTSYSDIPRRQNNQGALNPLKGEHCKVVE